MPVRTTFTVGGVPVPGSTIEEWARGVDFTQPLPGLLGSLNTSKQPSRVSSVVPYEPVELVPSPPPGALPYEERLKLVLPAPVVLPPVQAVQPAPQPVIYYDPSPRRPSGLMMVTGLIAVAFVLSGLTFGFAETTGSGYAIIATIASGAYDVVAWFCTSWHYKILTGLALLVGVPFGALCIFAELFPPPRKYARPPPSAPVAPKDPFATVYGDAGWG